MKLLIIIGLIFPYFSCIAQKEDFNWVMGRRSKAGNTNPEYGRFVLNFKNSELNYLETSFVQNKLDITNASISDSKGNLLLYTNGLEIYDSTFQIIENGDSLNPGLYAEINENQGYPNPNGALI